MKIIHIDWKLVGTIGVSDDDGELLTIGQNEQGQPVKQGNVFVPIPRFRGNEVSEAYQKARELCDKTLEDCKAEATKRTDPPNEAKPKRKRSK